MSYDYPENFVWPKREYMSYQDEGTNGEIRNFKCSRCDRSYKNKRHLQRHVKYICGKEPQFVCIYCRARFAHNYSLKVHMKTKHNIVFQPQP